MSVKLLRTNNQEINNNICALSSSFCLAYTSFLSLLSEIEEEEGWLIGEYSPFEKNLLLDLISIFECKDKELSVNETRNQVQHASNIIDEIGLNVNSKILPYGESFLSNAVIHSLDMVKMLLEKGADVNNEDTMDGITALDKIMELEECLDELPDDMKVIKDLLLSKGAKTIRQRMSQIHARFYSGERQILEWI